MADEARGQWPVESPVPGLREPESAPFSAGSRLRDEERTTRKPMSTGARLWLPGAALFGYFWVFWFTLVRNPLMDAGDAIETTNASGAGQFLIIVIVASVLLQLHYLMAENSAVYYRAWGRVYARNDHFWSRFSPWTRIVLARLAKLVIGLAVLAVVLGVIFDVSPFASLVYLPIALLQALPFALQMGFAFFFIAFQFIGLFWFLSRGGIDTYMPDDIKTRFSDVWGQDQVLERVKENIVFLENPEAIESRGGYVPTGILLWGPPGTGKTLMAEAVAGETGKPYVFVDPGAFNAMFMGVGILKVKALFRKLRRLSSKYGGVIVFFDEADSLGSRGGSVSSARPTAPVPEERLLSCNGMAYVSEGTRSLLYDERTASGSREFVAGAGMNMGGGSGTLQALLTELSGLKKPRGIVNRYGRRALGMRPKPPPHYRILVMMATNMPDALDAALTRPGRIDRSYRVGYPSKAGRIDTYRNYLAKIDHEVTDEQIERMATVSPYATGASIKDAVNEALVIAIRDGHDVVTYADLIRAKSLKQHGLPDGHTYVDREQHSLALHEACHAVVMYRLQHTSVIDTATIERRGDVGGFVAPIPIEDRFVEWRSEVEVGVMTFLASLAGERLFYDGDHTQGVGGDMAAATSIVTRSFLTHAMGPNLRAYGAGMLAQGGLIGPSGQALIDAVPFEGETAAAVEAKLRELYDRTVEVLSENRAEVLAVTHALETFKTLSGDDVAAVIDGSQGPFVDGSIYADPVFKRELEDYHSSAVEAHHVRHTRPPALPRLPEGLAAARASVADPAPPE